MRKRMFATLLLLLIPDALPVSPAGAAHPLITDDTGTQGEGKTQIEVNGEYGSDRETALRAEAVEREIKAGATISYGMTDTIDVVIGVPYLWERTHESDLTVPLSSRSNEKGLADVTMEMKWRFYEKDGLSFGFKPGVIVPTGSERLGLGAGRYGFSAFLIATQETRPWVFHANLGYIRNNNRHDEREDLNHVSLATEYRITDPVRIVANVGQDHNPDKTRDRKPVFGLVGIIYSVSKDFDVDAGFKAGLTDPETDSTVLVGMAWRF